LKIKDRVKLAMSAFGFGTKAASVTLDNGPAFVKIFSQWLNDMGAGSHVGYVASCANVWGRSFARTKFRLYDISDEDNSEVTNHIAVNILKRPNPFNYTWWEYKYRIATDFIYEGNSYFLKLRDGLGTVQALFQLHADRMRSYPYNIEKIDYYEYQSGTDVIKFKPEDIIHLKYPSRRNFISGSSLVSEMSDIVETEKLRQIYHNQVYKKGGFFGPMFTTAQTLTDKQVERLTELFKSKFGGTAEAYNAFIAHSGMEPVKTAYSLKELQNVEGQQFNQKEISSHFGINKLMLGESEQIQRGNTDAVINLFNSQVIDPLMDYIDDALNIQWIYPDYDTDYFIRHDKQATRDVELDLKYYQNGLQYGWLAPNEVRAEEGYEPIDNESFDLPKPITNQPINANANA
jgi:HK97 family phage portal protein